MLLDYPVSMLPTVLHLLERRGYLRVGYQEGHAWLCGIDQIMRERAEPIPRIDD